MRGLNEEGRGSPGQQGRGAASTADDARAETQQEVQTHQSKFKKKWGPVALDTQGLEVPRPLANSQAGAPLPLKKNEGTLHLPAEPKVIACVRTLAQTHMCSCTCSRTHARTYSCTQTQNMHIHTHAHTRTQIYTDT